MFADTGYGEFNDEIGMDSDNDYGTKDFLYDPKFPIKAQNCYPSRAKIVLGEEDTIINPKKTLEFITDQISYGFPKIEIENVDGMGHRIPLDIFINKIQNEL